MTPDLRVGEVRFLPAAVEDAERGLLGYVACVINNSLKLDGLTLRRTLAGELRLSWPARTDRAGNRHPLVHPVTDEVRREVERQVYAALRLEAAP
ncbi:MAG TPA: hypothetical protein VFY71_11985 [Planctomycetota bacterium]|nr:hypothetical protein [Planctomycetota bacterium]